MLKVVIRNRKDLHEFYDERRRAYVFEDNIEEVIFEDNRELHTIVSEIYAPNAQTYLQHEDVSLRKGAGIKAKAIHAFNIYVEGNIEVAFTLEVKSIKCEGSIKVNQIIAHTVNATEIIANTIYATEVHTEQIVCNILKSNLLEYTRKNIYDLRVEKFIKNLKSVEDLKEFYNDSFNEYDVPKNVRCISYYGEKPLKLSCPLYAKYTSLEIRKLITEEPILCNTLYGEYVKAENIHADFKIEVQVLIAFNVSCDRIICGCVGKMKHIHMCPMPYITLD